MEDDRTHYFASFANQCFLNSPTGERLFYFGYFGSPFSRPYVIPDGATEERLREKVVKLRWTHYLSIMVIGLVFIGAKPLQPYWIIICGLALGSVIALVQRILIARDLRPLQRLPDRLPLRSYLYQRALRDGRKKIGGQLLFSLLFVLLGTVALISPAMSSLAGLLMISIFLPYVIGACYCLKLVGEIEKSSKNSTS